MAQSWRPVCHRANWRKHFQQHGNNTSSNNGGEVPFVGYVTGK